MPILEIKDFTTLKQQNKNLMGIDYGDKVIGVSISEPNWSISLPLTSIENKKFTYAANEIFKIMDDRNIIGLVIGLPLNMDGTENKKCQSIRQFGRNLLKIHDINICFYDERFSTTLAQQNLDNADISWDRKQDKIDMIASSYILQGFLDKVTANKN